MFLGFCDEVIFRALPMTSQIQGRREILYFWLKSHVIFISVTLQCSRWLMCLVIALFLCRKSLPLSVVSGSIQVDVVRVLRLVVLFFVCFFSMRPRSQREGKPTSVRCRTVSQPPSRTYLLPKILSSITTDKLRLSAQFFWGEFLLWCLRRCAGSQFSIALSPLAHCVVLVFRCVDGKNVSETRGEGQELMDWINQLVS